MKGNAYVPFMLRRGDGSTLSLDFTAMGGTLDSRFTFTRSSTTSTYINSSGYVATAGTNVARFDYDPTTLAARGLLIEGSATNLMTYSEDYSQATWTKNNVDRTTGQASPDNQTGATLLAENSTSYVKHGIERSISISAGVYTFSVWVKEPSANSRRYVCLQLADGQGTAARYTIVADLQTGTITASGSTNGTAGAPTGTGHSITAYPNGWYRITIIMNHVASPSYPAICLSDISTLFGGNNQPFYAASSPYKSLIVWGAQLEAGSGASSYIPTGASTVQRTADTCIAASTGFSSWFTGGTSGTFYADWYGGVRGITSTVRTVLSTSDVTARHLHLHQTAPAGNLKVADFGAANVVTTSNSITSGARTKGAFSFSGGTVNLTLNGGTVATSSSLGFSTAPTWLVLGGTSTDGSTITDATVLLNGSIRAIKYWPSVLPTATLQSLTA